MNAVPRLKERSFPRYKIPLAGRIEGQPVSIIDWSVGGLGLADVDIYLEPGTNIVVDVIVLVNERKIEFPVKGEVAWMDQARRRAGIKLLGDGVAVAPLEELSDAYLAGRLTTGPMGLTIFDRETSDKGTRNMTVVDASKPAPVRQNLLGRIVGLVTFTIVGAAAFLFLANIVYERLFSFDALSANVAADTISVVIPTDGVVHFVGDLQAVSKGTKLAEVQGATLTDILSPCDCFVLVRAQQDGTFARAGQMIMTLINKNAEPYIAVRVPFRRLGDISGGARISLTYLDGSTVSSAKLLSIPKITEETAAQLIVNVEPGRKLDASMAGQPVYVKFDTAPWN